MSKSCHSLGQFGDNNLDPTFSGAEALMSNHRNTQANS